MKLIRYLLLFFALAIGHAKADEHELILPSGVGIVTIGEQRSVNDMAVFPAKGIAGRPLLIAAHGNGGSGPEEIKGWLELAKEHKITVVCPTFLSSVNAIYIPDDKPYFEDCLNWVQHHLLYDKSHAYMTGFSGGGYAIWYLAITRPDFFKGLFFQSCNFTGDQFNLDLSRWTDKPIHLVWGTNDLTDVISQNQNAVAYLQSHGCNDASFEIIQGASHESHRDLVIKWMGD